MERGKLVVLAIVAVMVMALVGIFIAINYSIQSNVVKYEERVKESFRNARSEQLNCVESLRALEQAIASEKKQELELQKGVTQLREKTEEQSREENYGATDKSIIETQKFVVENYPQMVTNTAYEKFMDAVVLYQNKVAGCRNGYNEAVKYYNGFVRNPLNKIVLALSGYQIIEYEDLVAEGRNLEIPEFTFGD